MSSNFTVIYDACVLYPAPLRDFLMRPALTELYRARWTDMIRDEWTRNVLKQRPDLKAEDLERTRSLMNAHVRGKPSRHCSMTSGRRPRTTTGCGPVTKRGERFDVA